jgi:hypothetical protein
VVAAAAVGNVAAVCHEIGMGGVAGAVSVATASVATASVAGAATSETTACEMAAAAMEATAMRATAAASVEAASATSATSATSASVRPTSATACRGSAPAAPGRGRGACGRRSDETGNAEGGSERDEASTHGCLPEDDVARATGCYHRLGRGEWR